MPIDELNDDDLDLTGSLPKLSGPRRSPSPAPVLAPTTPDPWHFRAAWFLGAVILAIGIVYSGMITLVLAGILGTSGSRSLRQPVFGLLSSLAIALVGLGIMKGITFLAVKMRPADARR